MTSDFSDHHLAAFGEVKRCPFGIPYARELVQLSGPFAALPPRRRAQALAAVMEFPSEIGLLGLRDLGPIMARLRGRHQLNILGIEALAATVQLGATVALSARSPRLEDALSAEGYTFAIAG